jgi:hypothetical protein
MPSEPACHPGYQLATPSNPGTTRVPAWVITTVIITLQLYVWIFCGMYEKTPDLIPCIFLSRLSVFVV